MAEYLIRVECSSGTFIVPAGHNQSFARKMFESFTLRDESNFDIPFTKYFLETHAEEKDAGIDGPVEIPTEVVSFDEFVDAERKEQIRKELTRKIKKAEEKVDKIVKEIEDPHWLRR